MYVLINEEDNHYTWNKDCAHEERVKMGSEALAQSRENDAWLSVDVGGLFPRNSHPQSHPSATW